MPETTVNTIYLRLARKVLLPSAENPGTGPGDALLATFLKNMTAYGYTFDTAAIEHMRTRMTQQAFIDFARDYDALLRRAAGMHVTHAPMYPNFPAQVMAASASELYVNAILHYLGDALGVRIMPQYTKAERAVLPESEFNALNVISLGDESDFNNQFHILAASKLAWSESDREAWAWYVQTNATAAFTQLPTQVPNRENLGTLAALARTLGAEAFKQLLTRASTPTDVLRIAAALSGSNVSLTDGVRFTSFPKWVRRALLAHLNTLAAKDTFLEDLSRHTGLWKILGERLHPGEYTARYPHIAAAFQILRNNGEIITHRGQVENAINMRDITEAIRLLTQRPGDFARRLDYLLRVTQPDQLPRVQGTRQDILTAFAAVAPRVSANVLWQVRAHFQGRANAPAVRAFYPKGNIGKVYGIDNALPALPVSINMQVVAICDGALHDIYAQLPTLGKVYLDPALTRYTLPAAVRNTGRDLNLLGRGSRISLPDARDTARFFIWWTDGASRTDLDLSALLLDADYNTIDQIAYYNLRGSGATHSGDITSAPHGASEYIDIDLPTMAKRGVAYVVMVVNAYTQQSFVELPECFAGVMTRDQAQSGEVYEPRTVDHRFDITAETKIAVPLVIDVNAREFVWTDLAMRTNPRSVNNVHGNRDRLTILTKSILNTQRPSLYDLFHAHATARGQLVTDHTAADTLFTATRGQVNVPAAEILGTYL